MKVEPIPLLSPLEIESHHFGDMAEWKPFHANFFTQFHINRIEDYREHIKFPLLPHRKTVFDFIFLTQGITTRTKGLDSYTFSKDTFFFLPAFQITTHEFMSPDTTGYFCHFNPEILNASFIQHKIVNEFPFLQFLGNPIVKIDQDVLEFVINILRRLEKEYKANQSLKLDILSAYLIALFAELNRYIEPIKKLTENSALRITQQYKNALMQYIYEKQTIGEYGKMLAVTPNHLNKCVKVTTGKSAQDLLFEMLLLEAKTLLKQTPLTVNEIAWKIGKEETSDFIRFFKSKTGLTPTEYRKAD